MPDEAGAIASLEGAANYLESLINHERRSHLGRTRWDLEPIRSLLERIGHPERGLSIIHIAGSKGKGSTCLFCESILQAQGERVGTFTSPHLSCWTERFRMGGEPVAGEVLAAAVEELRTHVDTLRAGPSEAAPSFFDATTATALLLFARARVDRVVLEVGLGGRLDSTNAVTPAVTCITSIEFEHTELLGSTLAAIAREKAGILKQGVPCVTGRLPVEALEVVRERASELDAPLYTLGVDFEAVASSALGVLGAHQAENAAIAVRAVGVFGNRDDADFQRAVARGLAVAQLPGRIELLEHLPPVIVDSAHTEASARALLGALQELEFARAHLVISVSSGKNLGAILAALLPRFDTVTATRADPIRSMAASDLARAIREADPGVTVETAADAGPAIREARRNLGPRDLLCIAGSIYLAGIAREVLGGSRRAAVA